MISFRHAATRWLVLLGSCLVLATALLASPAGAQNVDSLRAQYLLPVPPPVPDGPPAFVYRSAPGMGGYSPSGFGPGWGDVYVGATYQARARHSPGDDGNFGIGIGLGNPHTLVGLQLDVMGFSTFRSGWGNRMAFDLKAHRILPGLVGVAVGWEAALLRGVTDGGRSVYGVASKWFNLRPPSEPFSAVMLTAGVGNGRFQREDDFLNQAGKVNVFGTAAIRVLEPVSVIADWTGQDLVLATSWAPFPRYQFVITPSLVDVTGAAGDGVRFVVGAGYGFRFTGRR
jgi:hypothetical protein